MGPKALEYESVPIGPIVVPFSEYRIGFKKELLWGLWVGP